MLCICNQQISAEGERRQILWQHQRRLIKREMVLRKSRQEEAKKLDAAEASGADFGGSGDGDIAPESDELVVKLVDVIMKKYGDSSSVDVNVIEQDFLRLVDWNEENYLNVMGIFLPSVVETEVEKAREGEGGDVVGVSGFDRVQVMSRAAESGIKDLLAEFRKACMRVSHKEKLISDNRFTSRGSSRLLGQVSVHSYFM